MKNENKKTGFPVRSLLFLLPLTVMAAIVLNALTSMPGVPSELPEKLAYTEASASPAETTMPDESSAHGAEPDETATAEPAVSPERTTEPQTPEDTGAPEPTAPQSTEPTGSMSSPAPTAEPSAPSAAPSTAPASEAQPTATPDAEIGRAHV